MKTEIDKIKKLLQRTFDTGAWHGPSVKETIQDVTQDMALKRLPNTHSIIELITHMTSWRIFVTKKILGEDYEITDTMNFPAETDWKKVVRNLEESQVSLLTGFEQFPGQKLSELVQGVTGKYTYYTLLHSLIHHDLYHTGQIALIKKATGMQS